MNADERFNLFVLPDGVKKVSMVKDPKIPNAATFEFQKEDHTLGNTLKMELLKNPEILFAGYKVPHPLQHYFVLKVQTTSKTNPLQALSSAVSDLIHHTSLLEEKFRNEVLRIESLQPPQMQRRGDGYDEEEMTH